MANFVFILFYFSISIMVWHIVKFLKEDSVEAVPTSWHVPEKLACYWPPNGTKMGKILKYIKHLQPPIETWLLHSVTLLGTYEDFEIAQKKVEIAKTTSDISSSNGIMKGFQGKRARKKNRKYFEEDESSEIESDSDSETCSFPSFKRKNVDSFGKSPKKRSNSLTPKGNTQTRTPMTRRSRSFSPQKKTFELSENEDMPQIEPKNTSIITRDNAGQADVNIRTSTALKDKHHCCASDTEFKKLVLQELAKLNLQIAAVHSSVATLIDIQNMQVASNALPNNANKNNLLKVLQDKLPISSIEKLHEFEDWLKEEENYNFLVTELRRIGGHSYAQLVRKILYKTLSNEVAINFSWDGHKQKTAFKNLSLAKAILDAVKIHFQQSSDTEIINVIKLWLVKAKERTIRAIKLNENH